MFSGHPFLGFGDLELAGQALFFGQDQLVALGQVPELPLQGRRLLGLFAELRLHRGELLFGNQGFRRAALQLLAQGLDIGLGGDKLLQEIRLLQRKLDGLLVLLLQVLPESLHLLLLLLQLLPESLDLPLALAQQHLLLVRRLTCLPSRAAADRALCARPRRCQPHHVLPACRADWLHRIGCNRRLDLPRHTLAGRLVDIDRRKRQQAHQQEVADDDRIERFMTG